MEPKQTNQFVRMIAGGQTYCLDIAYVRGILGNDAIQQESRTRGSLGFVPTGAGLVPIWHLRERLAEGEEVPEATGPIILLNSQIAPWGICVDHLQGSIEVQPENRFPLPEVVQNTAAPIFGELLHCESGLHLVIKPDSLHPQATPQKQAMVPPAATPGTAEAGTGQGGKLFHFTTVPFSESELALRFGVSLTQVVEILDPLPVTPVPTAPNYISGVAGWREGVLPVVNLSLALGFDFPDQTAPPRLLVVRTAQGRKLMGIPIQRDAKVQNLPLATQPFRGELPVQGRFLRTICEWEGALLLIPDLDQLAFPEGTG
ncbi:MAG: chemotaxis protein CheW [Blastocatellia bacterium]|nr:chemotaxis protein CheW [Blastocatellia bacterium]